jgi:hypothetical protein
VAIRRSAAVEIQPLIDDLCGPDAVARETAGARLAVIGERAVPHLIRAFERTGSAVARAAILKVFEACRDSRGLDIALDIVDDAAADPKVLAAAVAVLGAHLDGAEGARALDALSALALDRDHGDVARLQAADVMERALPAVVAPLRTPLAKDPSGAVRQWATSGAAREVPAADPRAALAAVAGGAAADPVLLRALVADGAADMPLTTLHRVIEQARLREARLPAEADRAEWMRVRGAVHFALAIRGSRVAAYDLRETLAGATQALPPDFIAAAGLVGDASCLETIAGALAAPTATLDVLEQRWRDDLVRAGRAIVQRERLTRRHAAVRKIAKVWPAIADVLLAAGS